VKKGSQKQDAKTATFNCRIEPRIKKLIRACADIENTTQINFFWSTFEIGMQQKNKIREKNRRIISKILNKVEL